MGIGAIVGADGEAAAQLQQRWETLAAGLVAADGEAAAQLQ